MPSDLQLSLCIPEIIGNNSEKALRDFTENVTQFFAKFPLSYEVLFAVKSHQQKESASFQSVTQTLAAKGARMRGIVVPRSHSRAQTLERLFTEAQGQILVASSLDLRTPLGGVFKMLQELYTEPEVQAVFGNRGLKKSPQPGPQRKDALEEFFQNVITDRSSWPYKDLFCTTFAMRKTAFDAIQPELGSSGYHWTLEIQRAVQRKNLKAIEVPVFEATTTARPDLTGMARVRESFKLLAFVLFRIRGENL